VELGTGGGMLTRQLARAAREVVAVEYDRYWVSHLKERFSGDGHVRVVYESALRVKLAREPFRGVANVPFYITTSILDRF
jgi:23S rRNA (adenine-N6)-dimethyltransferase